MSMRVEWVCGAFAAGWLLCGTAGAQTIRVGPVLQDAEPASVWVMWETTSGTGSVVEYGLTAGLGSTANGSAIPSSGTSQIHHTQISGLEPDTVYFYRVRTGNATSQTYSFRTPASASAEQSFRFAAISDTQGGSNSGKHAQVINQGIIGFIQAQFGPQVHDELAFVIEPGDLVAAGSEYAQWKDQYFDEAFNLYRSVPIYPVPGNHEQDSHWFFDYFHLPVNGTPGFEEHWWFKDHGNLRIIGIDSNGGYQNQQQLDWLDGVLADAAADGAIDFVFAQMHHPYLSEPWTPGNTAYTGQVVHRLEQFTASTGKPSAHFFGHTHAYSRGQSREHEHLWVNVASGEGDLDYWGLYPIADYPEYQRTFIGWGFVLVEVEAGAAPQFRLRRVSLGNDVVPRDNEVMDDITIRLHNQRPSTPSLVSPVDGASGVSPESPQLLSSGFADPDGDFHLESQFQVTNIAGDYASPVVDQWTRFENWFAPSGASGPANGYYSVDTVSDPDITISHAGQLESHSTYFWRARYRDSGLAWSVWSDEFSFTTGLAPVGACCYVNAACSEERESVCSQSGGTWLGQGSDCSSCPPIVVVYAEDFDSVPLGPGVDESLPGDAVWTPVPPWGWYIDRSGMPLGGVTEWRGWAFADPAWWTAVAGDQERSGFMHGSGAIAVADPDEWDDLGHAAGTYNSWLESPGIDVSRLRAGSARLIFDSSWRPWANQRGVVHASYDGGPAITVLDWESQPGANYKPDTLDELVIVELNNPPGAQVVELQFGLLDAGNDWWWAIDNVVVAGRCAAEFAPPSDELNFFDLQAFLAAFSAHSPEADLNADTVFDFFDVQAYLQAYSRGCP